MNMQQKKWYARRSFAIVACLSLLVGAVSTYVLASWVPGTEPQHAIIANGTLEGDEISVSTKISARVAGVHAGDGDEVQARALLFTLDLSELEAQRQATLASLHSAEAKLAAIRAGARDQEIDRTRAELAETTFDLRRLENGSRPEEVLQAEATVHALEAAHARTGREYTRCSTLFASGDVPRTRLDLAQAELAAATGRLEVARQQLALARAGARTEERAAARERLRQRQADYDLVRAGARPEDIAVAEWAVEQIKATLRMLDVQLAEGSISAPADATVTHVVAKPGEVVAPGQTLATIASYENAWVDVFIDETAIGTLEVGQPAELRFRAFPGKSFSGRVSSINETRIGEKQTKDSMNVRSVRVRVDVEKRDRHMRPGMSVEASILTGTAR